MKFIITLKDPDGIADSVCEAATDQLAGIQYEMQPFEYDAVREQRADTMFEVLRRWSPDGDSIRIEIDTEAGTARVLGARE